MSISVLGKESIISMRFLIRWRIEKGTHCCVPWGSRDEDSSNGLHEEIPFELAHVRDHALDRHDRGRSELRISCHGVEEFWARVILHLSFVAEAQDLGRGQRRCWHWDRAFAILREARPAWPIWFVREPDALRFGVSVKPGTGKCHCAVEVRERCIEFKGKIQSRLHGCVRISGQAEDIVCTHLDARRVNTGDNIVDAFHAEVLVLL